MANDGYLASVCINQFESSRSFSIGEGDVSLSWRCRDAARIEIHRRPKGADGWIPVDQEIQLLHGQIDVHIDEDTEFRLRAHPRPSPELGKPPVAERILCVELVHKLEFHGLLVAVSLALISNWYISEGLFHGVDLVEDTELLRWGRTFSRMVAVVTSIVSAPLLATLIQLRAGRPTTVPGFTYSLLRKSRLVALATVVALVFPVAAICVGATTERIYISSELGHPVHAWDCDREHVRLTIPPGLNSALVNKNDPWCLNPSAVIRRDCEPTALECAPMKTESPVMLACNQRVILNHEPDNQFNHVLTWDSGGVSSFKTEGKAYVATRWMKDCNTFAQTARFERKARPSSGRTERLTWELPLEPSDNAITDFALSSYSIKFAKIEGSAPPAHVYVTLGFDDTWQASARCPGWGSDCKLTIPPAERAPGPSYLCVSPSAQSELANTSEACGRNQPWSLFQMLEDNELAGFDIAPLKICLSPASPVEGLRLSEGGASWQGSLDPQRIAVVHWAPLGEPEQATPPSVTIGGNPVDLEYETLAGCFRERVTTRSPATVQLTLNGLPMDLESCRIFDADNDPAKFLAAVTIRVKNRIDITFNGLPEWATDHATKWRARGCSRLDHASCLLRLNIDIPVLACETHN